MSLVKSYYNNREEADDSSTVFDADTVVSVSDEVPSLTPPTSTSTATLFTEVEADSYYYHHHQFNYSSSNNNIGSSHPHSSQEESHSPPASIPKLFRCVNSLPVPSTIITTASTSTTTTPITAEGESSYTSSSSHHSSSRTHNNQVKATPVYSHPSINYRHNRNRHLQQLQQPINNKNTERNG
eukprot:CAMPEP_0178956050 /NCGR_PEP_ID=MMETSP0789-20121207/9986_1 /TAXON_ID=3005 /ORGANISM="Rhizosolenia setigera, Strain CCMP 1694" /LENGTH=182 /DNA_ID=CAMNT_0020637831 /DNA_START=219 /DNA_END=767 /DNA_ORIENTATION=+